MGVRYRWVILAVGLGAQAAIAAPRLGIPSLAPMLRDELSLTLPQVGVALAGVSVGIVTTLLPWGILADRVGERRVLAVGLTGTAAALAGTAYAPSFGWLVAGLVATGMLGASATGAT